MTSAAELFAMERATLNGSVLLWTPDGWRLAVSAFDPFAGAPMADEDLAPACPREAARLARLKPCGTRAAYVRHKRHGEPIDDECRAALRAYSAERGWPLPQPVHISSTDPAPAAPMLCTPTGSPLLVSVAGQGKTGRTAHPADDVPDSNQIDSDCRRATGGLSA